VLVIACGALARELGSVVRLNRLEWVDVEYLPGILHNRPERITAAVEARVDRVAGRYDRIVVGYADCGTGGHLDELCRRRGLTPLPGAHCYQLLAGADTFAHLQEAEPGTFYLTDYLARHVDRLVFQGLGLDRHPELADAYFGHYRRLVYLSQGDDPALVTRAEGAARRLGLDFEHRPTGLGPLAGTVVGLVAPTAPTRPVPEYQGATP
jgi:hypothetical protein